MDVINNRWDYLPSMKIPRHGHACGVVNYRQIIVAGGKSVFGSILNTDSVELLSLKTLEWEYGERLPVGIYKPGYMQHENTIVLFGGSILTHEGSSRGIKMSLQFDEVTLHWFEREDTLLSRTRAGHSVFSLPGVYSCANALL